MKVTFLEKTVKKLVHGFPLRLRNQSRFLCHFVRICSERTLKYNGAKVNRKTQKSVDLSLLPSFMVVNNCID